MRPDGRCSSEDHVALAKQPVLKQLCGWAKRAAFAQAIARLHQLSGAAVTTLGKVMVDPPHPGHQSTIRRSHFEPIRKGESELEDIEARLSALERGTQVK